MARKNLHNCNKYNKSHCIDDDDDDDDDDNNNNNNNKVKFSLEQATKAQRGEQMYSSTLP